MSSTDLLLSRSASLSIAVDVWKEQMGGPHSQLDQIYEGRDDTDKVVRGRLTLFQAARAASQKSRQATTSSSSVVPRDSDCGTSEVDFEDYIWDEWDDEQCTGAGTDGVREAEKAIQSSSSCWDREIPPADGRRATGPPGKMMPPSHHVEDHMTHKVPAELTGPSSKLHPSYTQSCSFFTAGTVGR